MNEITRHASMLKHHQDILETVLDIIKRKYADDISIMLVYGSGVNGTSHEKSDLDMIYIPKNERGYKLARTFILDGVGYDIWGADWVTLERFANFDDMKVSVIADSQLVYYADDDDKKRYDSLKKAAQSIASGPLTTELIEKAKMHLTAAKQYYGELCIEYDLTTVGILLMKISDALCLLNHTYLHFGSKRMIEELSKLKRLPKGFISAFRAVIEHPDDAKKECCTLIKLTEQLFNEIEEEISLTAVPDFSGFYEEISSHWNKIRHACHNGDAMNAFLAATSLQNELDYVLKGLGVDIEEVRFIDKYDPSNLALFSCEADKAEAAFVSILRKKGIPIISYDSIYQLKQALEE